MWYQVDIVIVGAGVIGLAVASQVAKEGRQVYVLERNETFGRETSSRNSEVIHTSIFYPKGSLNAKMCTESNSLLYELCENYSIGYKKIGKLIVAIDDTEVGALGKLFEEGKEDRVNLKMLSQRELNRVEPNVSGVAAIFPHQQGL